MKVLIFLAMLTRIYSVEIAPGKPALQIEMTDKSRVHRLKHRLMTMLSQNRLFRV